MKLPSTTQSGFGSAYQLGHDFRIQHCCCYPTFVEMLYKQFKVLVYTKVECIKGTLTWVYVTVKKKREFTKTELCFPAT